MSQPPQQPPADPPQGGFGAPQDPPPGGFGAPVPPPDARAGQPPAPSQQGAQQPQPPGTPPPPGGYGAPQQPPAAPQGGYGAPQAPYGQPPQGGQPQGPAYGYPPAAPGYGYPQAPQQPGYGYPPTATSPQPGQPGYFGQPGQHGQAYGYPTQPQYPVTPQGDGGGKKKLSAQMKIIIAAAVAVVLIVGGGALYATSSGDDGKKTEASTSGTEGKGGGEKEGGLAGGKEKAPASTASELGFKVPEPEVADVATVRGSWITDKVFVKTGLYEIVAYDLDKGTKVWSVPTAGQLCAASRFMTDDYRTAIAFQEAKPTKADKYPSCNQVGALDLKTGKMLWSKSVLGGNGDEPVRFDEVTVSGSTVAAGGLNGGAAFQIADGKELWKPKVSTDGCYDKGYGGGAGLVAVRRCGTSDEPQLSIQALNPATGAPLSSFDMPAGVEYAAVVSSDPLVVAANVGDTAGDGSAISDYFSIDRDTGKLIVRISADADRYGGDCGSTEVEMCSGMTVGNNRLYVPTEPHEGKAEFGDTNEVVAFDLTTGKLSGPRADAGERYSLVPLRMDGTNVIAYKEPPYDKGGQVVSLDGATLKETLLMENPADDKVREAETAYTWNGDEFDFADGRLFFSQGIISSHSGSAGRERNLVVSFSTH